jgi:hypothetical protein
LKTPPVKRLYNTTRPSSLGEYLANLPLIIWRNNAEPLLLRQSA